MIKVYRSNQSEHGQNKYINSYLTIILNAPRGVTRTAGANAYATKFAISPTITISKIINQDGFCEPSVEFKRTK